MLRWIWTTRCTTSSRKSLLLISTDRTMLLACISMACSIQTILKWITYPTRISSNRFQTANIKTLMRRWNTTKATTTLLALSCIITRLLLMRILCSKRSSSCSRLSPLAKVKSQWRIKRRCNWRWKLKEKSFLRTRLSDWLMRNTCSKRTIKTLVWSTQVTVEFSTNQRRRSMASKEPMCSSESLRGLGIGEAFNGCLADCIIMNVRLKNYTQLIFY